MRRLIENISQETLQGEVGVNTHVCWKDSSYTDQHGNMLDTFWDTFEESNILLVRERYFPGLKGQLEWFNELENIGGSVYATIGDEETKESEYTELLDHASNQNYFSNWLAFTGCNETNNSKSDTWELRNLRQQIALQKAVNGFNSKRPSDLDSVPCVSSTLKYNVPDWNADVLKLLHSEAYKYCDYGDWHFYPGNAGPIVNINEYIIAKMAFPGLPMFMSETGWTNQDTDETSQAWFTLEAIVRNHFMGIQATFLYEFMDDEKTEGPHSGKMGLVRSDGTPKPAYYSIEHLLAPVDIGYKEELGTQFFFSGKDDASAFVRSYGDRSFTVFVAKGLGTEFTVIAPDDLVPVGYDGSPTQGADRDMYRWSFDFGENTFKEIDFELSE